MAGRRPTEAAQTAGFSLFSVSFAASAGNVQQTPAGIVASQRVRAGERQNLQKKKQGMLRPPSLRPVLDMRFLLPQCGEFRVVAGPMPAAFGFGGPAPRALPDGARRTPDAGRGGIGSDS
jgi:hypothetical protein